MSSSRHHQRFAFVIRPICTRCRAAARLAGGWCCRRDRQGLGFGLAEALDRHAALTVPDLEIDRRRLGRQPARHQLLAKQLEDAAARLSVPIASSARRWSAVARRSMYAHALPCRPRCGPGSCSRARSAGRRSASRQSAVLDVPHTPRQRPSVGRALKLHGQPQSQLQAVK